MDLQHGSLKSGLPWRVSADTPPDEYLGGEHVSANMDRMIQRYNGAILHCDVGSSILPEIGDRGIQYLGFMLVRK